MNSRMGTLQLVGAYLLAKRGVIEEGFSWELAWQAGVTIDELSVERFVGEAAWVITSAGMRESVVRGLFPKLTEAMEGFDPIRIMENHSKCRADALSIFGHSGKIGAILSVAEKTLELGLDGIHKGMRSPEDFLRSLPYVGPVTWRHLAKNLGISIPKDDRHLVRLARVMHRSSVDALCQEIGEWLNEPTEVVDIVLWRWSVLHAGACTKDVKERSAYRCVPLICR